MMQHVISRLSVIVAFSALWMLFSGCPSVKQTTTSDRDTTSQNLSKHTDPFAGLDDELGEIDPAVLQERLEAARQQWLRALAAEQRKDKAEVVRRFENAIEILSRLIYYTGVSENKDFQELSRSVIEDYEKFVSDIDILPPDASIFAFRQKFNEEIAKIDIRKLNIPKAPDLSNLRVPLTINPAVEQSIAYFMQGNGRTYMQRWLGRSGKFFPMMRRIFREVGTPEELIYLSMVESGLNPTVVSRAQAVGLWQFIQSTGAMYGLRSNWWFDEKRDPEKATRAAARHLNDLYRAMGDWHLALSCYNCSMTRIKRCMNEMQDSTFWGIRPCLPKETQNYIPLYIAATIIAMEPARYGFTDIAYEPEMTFDTVRVFEAVDLNALGMASGVSGLEIKNLNPELLQPSTPPQEVIGNGGYVLRIPVGTREQFYAGYARLTPEEKRPWLVHNVTRGESLKSIARSYGITVDQLADYNNMNGSERIKPGSKLRIPMSVMAPSTVEENGSKKEQTVTAPAPPSGTKITHRMQRGETLASIADRYGIRVADIRNWNNLSYSANVKAGKSLVIYVEKRTQTQTASTDYHRVRKGETLAKIADEYDVDLADLKKWNAKLLRNGLRSGERLRITAPVQTASKASQSERLHKVRPGETMYSIAKAYKMSLEQLAALNDGKDPSTLEAGQMLKVYGENKTPSVGDSDKTPASKPRSHRVAKGETLFSIAKKYGIEVDDLKSANNLRSNHLQAGKRLVIPLE